MSTDGRPPALPGSDQQRFVTELRSVPLAEIMEPENPARIGMDASKLLELQGSMARVGLLQPIIIYPRGELYEIAAGHRRFLCARELRWHDIPALICPDSQVAIDAVRLHENTYREDMTAAEEAVYYRELTDKYHLTEEQLCSWVQQSADYIGDRLRLLRGCEQVFRALQERKIIFSVARELNKITEERMRLYYLDVAVNGGHSARVVSGWVAEWKGQRQTLPPQPAPAAPGQAEPLPAVSGPRCFCCGGDKDPYNLVVVHIHKWELDAVVKALRAPAE